MRTVAVLGGGFVGVATAYALQRRGFDVTLVERHRYPAMETSFANGGQLSASNAEVWTHPATVLKGLKWMLSPDAPLLVNPRPSWHKYSWMAAFLAAMPQYRRNTVETARMAIAARGHLADWAVEEGIAFDRESRGILHVYRSKAAFDHAAKVSRLYAEAGLERSALDAAGLRTVEPALTGPLYGGFHTPSDQSGDIHKFAAGLARAVARRGGQTLWGHEVVHLTPEMGGTSVTLRTEGRTRQCRFDAVVISAGVASRALARQCGDRVNIYPVKGYSITVDLADAASRAAAPRVSLLDDETKLVSSRLGEGRLRVAGTAEFNGANRDIRADRIAPLVRWVETLFPEVSTEAVTPWAGLRPMMPDMMPKVGAGRAPGVFYNTGHGHLGWTLGAVTAEMLAERMAGQGARRLHPVSAPPAAGAPALARAA
ncbi:D-amino acid dehydrogenase [Rhodobacteraceae bacterium CCMM004]|nr:D-amino acid dehydrogenase [Rhodobacteraceae bacterium CCMM004]